MYAREMVAVEPPLRAPYYAHTLTTYEVLNYLLFSLFLFCVSDFLSSAILFFFILFLLRIFLHGVFLESLHKVHYLRRIFVGSDIHVDVLCLPFVSIVSVV